MNYFDYYSLQCNSNKSIKNKHEMSDLQMYYLVGCLFVFALL